MRKQEENPSIEATLAVVVAKLGYIEQDIAEIKNNLKKEYVTVQEFKPVKDSVYGVISVVIISIIGFFGFLIKEYFFIKK